MKRKIIIVSLMLFLGILIINIGIYYKKINNEYSSFMISNDYDRIEIVRFNKHNQYTLTEKEDILELIEFLNTLKIRKINFSDKKMHRVTASKKVGMTFYFYQKDDLKEELKIPSSGRKVTLGDKDYILDENDNITGEITRMIQKNRIN